MYKKREKIACGMIPQAIFVENSKDEFSFVLNYISY